MDCSRALVGAGLAAFLVGQVNHETAFVPMLSGRSSASAAGLAAGAARSSPGAAMPHGSNAMVVAAVALGAAAGATRRSSARSAQRVAMKGAGPITIYTQALMDVAVQKEETDVVTKDVIKAKSIFNDEDFLGELQFVQNELGTTELKRANGLIKLMEPMESAVFPKFVTFLAKKKRLSALRSICSQYVSSLYKEQSVAPVTVRSASRLTDKQIDDIKSKMKAKIGAKDIKLISEVDFDLLGGFVIEWGYTDPVKLNCPTEGMDLSLKTALKSAALNKGVVAKI